MLLLLKLCLIIILCDGFGNLNIQVIEVSHRRPKIPPVLVILLIHYQAIYLRPETGKKVMQIQLYKNVLTFLLEVCVIREY